MTQPRPTFWSTLALEQKVRLCAGGALLFTIFLSTGLNAYAPPVPEVIGEIGLVLLVYVGGGEFIGLILANVFGIQGVSLVAALLAYGMTHFARARWIIVATFVIVIIYGLYLSPNAPDGPPWFGK